MLGRESKGRGDVLGPTSHTMKEPACWWSGTFIYTAGLRRALQGEVARHLARAGSHHQFGRQALASIATVRRPHVLCNITSCSWKPSDCPHAIR